MLEFYRAKYSLIRDGRTIVSKYGWHELLRDEPPQNFRTALTWADIEKQEINYVAPKIKYRRRGKVLIYGDMNTYFSIKEWKEPTLDLEYAVTYQRVDMSLSDVLDYYDSKAAMKYLGQHWIKCNVGF